MIEGITKGIDKLFSMDKQTGKLEELATVTGFEYTPAKGNDGDFMVYSTEAKDFITMPADLLTSNALEGKTIVRDGDRLVTDDMLMYKKAADGAIALKDMTIKGLEAIEDQLSDIQTALDDISESISYGSDAYWHKQVVDLTKFYLQDMIAQRHRSGVKLTEQDVITLVSVATNVATKSVEAIKEQVND